MDWISASLERSIDPPSSVSIARSMGAYLPCTTPNSVRSGMKTEPLRRVDNFFHPMNGVEHPLYRSSASLLQVQKLKKDLKKESL